MVKQKCSYRKDIKPGKKSKSKENIKLKLEN